MIIHIILYGIVGNLFKLAVSLKVAMILKVTNTHDMHGPIKSEKTLN